VIIRSRRLAALGAVVFLVSCNGDADAPATLPDITTSPSPTAVLTDAPGPATDVDPPVEPDDAHEYSAEGVEAFTRYAIDVINYAYQTNDVSLLQEIMTDNCQTCANTVRNVGERAAKEERVVGGELIVEEILAVGPSEAVLAGSVADVTITASRTLDASDSEISSRPEEQLQLVFTFTWEEDEWSIDAISYGADR
jgi:hypothetical protein